MNSVLKVAIYIVVAILVIAFLIGFGMYGFSVVFHSDKSDTTSETSSDASDGEDTTDEDDGDDKRRESVFDYKTGPFTGQEVTEDGTLQRSVPGTSPTYSAINIENSPIEGGLRFRNVNIRQYIGASGKVVHEVLDDGLETSKDRLEAKKELELTVIRKGPHAAIFDHYTSIKGGNAECWHISSRFASWIIFDGVKSERAAFLLPAVYGPWHWKPLFDEEMTPLQMGHLLYETYFLAENLPGVFLEPAEEDMLGCCFKEPKFPKFGFSPSERRVQDLFLHLEHSDDLKDKITTALDEVFRWRVEYPETYAKLVAEYQPKNFKNFPPFYMTYGEYMDSLEDGGEAAKAGDAAGKAEELPAPDGEDDPAAAGAAS